MLHFVCSYVFFFFFCSAVYEEEILERIVIPLFANIQHENDTNIRTSVGQLLIDFIAQCDTKRALELLDIIEKIINRPFDKFTDDMKNILKNEAELEHLVTIADDLIHVSIFVVIKIQF